MEVNICEFSLMTQQYGVLYVIEQETFDQGGFWKDFKGKKVGSNTQVVVKKYKADVVEHTKEQFD